MDPSNLLDMFLLKASLSYHGSQLLEKLQAEQQIDIRGLLSEAQTGLVKHERDEFSQRLLQFIAKKADLLFTKDGPGVVHWPCNSVNEDHFAAVPPLEHFMDIQKTQRRQHFQEGIEFGNVIIGVVTAVQENGLLLNILTIEIGQIRHLDQLKLVAFCPLREISRSHSHDDVLESFSLRDKVRAVVLDVQEDRLIVSLQKRHLPSSVDLHLGLVNDEDLPLHYRRLLESLDSGGSTYESYLRQVLEFHNPSSVANLTSMFGIKEFGQQQPSLMRGLFRVKYKEEDYGDCLRKGQSYRMAMKSVAEGVKRFKNGENLEAMQLFNRALQIDAENNEALVARGAIYANCESYERAIHDFEEAIRLNPSHANAKKYLHQTLTAFAHNLMDRNLDLAESYVKRAIELNPNNEETMALMKLIQKKLESDQKASPLSSDSGRDVNENESVINHAKEILVKMIRDDQSGRSGHQKSRTLSDASDKWSIGDRRLSLESTELSKQNQLLLQCNDEDKNRKRWNDSSPSSRQRVSISTTGDKIASSSKVFKSMMTSGHCEGSAAGLKQYPPAVFGPALPPRMAKKKTKKRQKKKSYKSSSSSSSRSSSRSSSSTDSISSSSSSTSSPTSSSSSSHSTKKCSKNSGSHKSAQKRSPIRKKNVRSEEKANRGNRNTSRSIKFDVKSDRQKKQSSQEADSARRTRDSSEYSRNRNHKTSPVYERQAKRMKMDREDSDDRRGKSTSFSKRRVDDDSEAKKQDRNKSSEKKSFVEYSSSSSDSCDDGRSEKKRKKPDSGQVKKEAEGIRPAEGETLEDIELFLQQLKAKKVMAK